MTPTKALAIAKAWLTRPFAADPVRDAAYVRRYVQTVRLDRIDK